MLTLKEQKKAAKIFAKKWEGIGDEKQDSQRFWMELLQTVYGIENPSDFIRFEHRVQLENISYIDAMIPATHTMIEQKSFGKDLSTPIRQSDGSILTPIEQAKRYAAALPHSEHPRWIISCNFSEFHILDMERPNEPVEVVKLKNLGEEYYRLNFLVDIKDDHIQKELEISKSAGILVSNLYNALLAQYKEITTISEIEIFQHLNKLCVRLVFCLYAEDAGLFGKRNMFSDYLRDTQRSRFRRALVDLFTILDTEETKRNPYEDPLLLEFPYVNGGLFSEIIEIPQFSDKAIDLLLNEACNFDWSQISPTIFGSIFESTLNPETRREGGMHYTSLENIHKLIDPLFLNHYKEKFQLAMLQKVTRKRFEMLKDLQNELATLTFLDPASGSGNFLTESYLSLRRLENDILRETITDASGSGVLGFEEDEFNPIKVSIQQFYGIEINDFAVSVAKTAMWIAEAQMFNETTKIIHKSMNFLPLHNYANIKEGNSLTMDWPSVIKPEHLRYIIGNPPFVGIRHSNSNHRNELKNVLSVIPKSGALDYVSAWYVKASLLLDQNPRIKVAFVSTNSIVQGEQASTLWYYLLEEKKLFINFAYKTFKWKNEASNQAAVHCVIIGFSKEKLKKNILFSEEGLYNYCDNINQYLLNGSNIWVTKRSKPIASVPEMIKGCYPTDHGYYIFTEDEYLSFIKKEPNSKKYFRRWIGSDDMLNNKIRYILFLKDCPLPELRKMPLVMERVEGVRAFRLQSTKLSTQKKADTPLLLDEERIPNSTFLVIPVVSSENR